MSFKMEMKRKTILFDLDGTLLPMDMAAFEKAYFAGLCKKMAEHIEPKELYHHIWEGTKRMIRNDGKKTNQEVFQTYLNEHTPLNYDVCEPTFLDYYEHEFQDCVMACQISERSRKIIDVLQEKGYQTAIATNPIFPQIATDSRLKWLGIDPARFPLVTTFEHSHHAKPDPRYYQEVCERLQVNPHDCVMVGNDVIEDGVAATLGMRVMFITDCLLHEEKMSEVDHEMGTLAEFHEWCLQLPKAGSMDGFDRS